MAELGKPYNAQIELVRGCNLKCDFCANRTIPEEKMFMSLDMAMEIGLKLRAFDPFRVEMALRGEPTLHPKLITITGVLRQAMPKTQLTMISNGVALTRELAERFLRIGNVIAVDCYGGTYDHYRERFDGLPVYDFYDGEFNPWHRHKPGTRAIVLIKDIAGDVENKRQRVLFNQAGNVDFNLVSKYGLKPLEQPLKKKCVNPFRELVIFYNGNISLCCKDWKEEMVLANIKDVDIKDFWFNDPKINMARALLVNRRRDFGICKRCDSDGGMRQGFLPDMKIEDYIGECSWE